MGDSERMLNEIADRAQLIPWETCFLIIDEIDSLEKNGSLIIKVKELIHAPSLHLLYLLPVLSPYHILIPD